MNVFEAPSTEQPARGLSGPAESERLRLVAGGIVVALVLAVVMLRLYRLSEIPAGIWKDEGAHGVNALQVLQGNHAVFFPESSGREGMIVYAVALATSILGRTMLAVRLPTALASVGTVFVVFWLGKLLFGQAESGRYAQWRGLLVGGVAAGLLAVSASQTVLGRLAYRGNFLPLFLCLCLALLWKGWRQRSWWYIVPAGVCAGLLPYTYIPARFTPLLFLLFGLSFLIPPGTLTREKVRAELPRAAVFLGVAALFTAPILLYFALHPEQFFFRSNQVSILRSEFGQEAPWIALLRSVWNYLLSLGFRGDPSWLFNVPQKPLLNPLEASFFLIGVGTAIWRWQERPAYRLLLLWMGILLLPAVLAISDNSPHFLRMIGAVPAIYMLTAVGVWEAFHFLRERYLRQSGSKPVFALAAGASLLILVQGMATYRTYFDKWAVESELSGIYNEGSELAEVLNALPPKPNTAVLIPSFRGNYSFDYLYQGAMPAYHLNPHSPNLEQDVATALSRTGKVDTLKVVEWKSGYVGVWEDTGRLGFLLKKHGTYQSSEEYEDFHLHTLTALSQRRPWTFYEYLEPLAIEYDGGIATQGLALGQGDNQSSSRELLDLRRNRPLWMAIQWKTDPGLDVDYALSLRLYNEEGEIKHQEDSVLWSRIHSPTGHWSAGEPVDTLVMLDIPGGLPFGEYELRLVVYNFETQAPTVQIDVWEPETTLARLRLTEGG